MEIVVLVVLFIITTIYNSPSFKGKRGERAVANELKRIKRL